MYIPPDEVVYPTTRWRLVDVLLDSGEEQAVYALGWWNETPAIGFRWNGGRHTGKLGSPQLRGMPTWTILDPLLHAAVVALLPSEKQSLTRRFLGLDPPADWQPAISAIRGFHRQRLAAIAAGQTPIPTLGNMSLVLHVIPLFDSRDPVSPEQLLAMAERFPPPGSHRPAVSRCRTEDFLNCDTEAKIQQSYVHVSRSGNVEAVVSNLGEQEHSTSLGKLGDLVATYCRHYAAGLSSAGITPPYAVMVGLVGCQASAKHKANHIEPESGIVELPGGLFETVPAGLDETLNCLKNLLVALRKLGTPIHDDTGSSPECRRTFASGSADCQVVWTRPA